MATDPRVTTMQSDDHAVTGRWVSRGTHRSGAQVAPVPADPGGVTRLRVGSATSQLDEASAAGQAAASGAVAALGDTPAGLVIVYSSIRYDLTELLRGVRAVTGDTPLVGASTAGHFSDAEFVPPGTGVAVMVLGAGPYQFGTAAATGVRADPNAAGRDVARAALAAAGPQRAPHGALMVLADGLGGDMPALLTGMYRITGAAVPVVGGCAADDRRLIETYVFHDGEVLTDAVVAVWIGGQRPMRVVSGHGWEANGLPMLVTKADGQVVHEIAGRPAMEVYKENFRYEDPLLKSSDSGTAGWYTAHSFGLIEPDGTQLIRGVFIGEDGLMRTFAPLPAYAAVQIVSANRDDLLDISEKVVADTLEGIDDAAVMLTFSCVARMDLFGERGHEEANRLYKAASPVSTFGFYTYGEFARTTSVAGYHNATITALAL